ncbi:BTAD domain-containing putative transcriptional regulator [Bradyrhizobium sp. OAE829]|uniref:BTAD domain-containing putative transcriptional regulator n=1 Tax=Bradyrhizobium sp. OAE829 TaxID=2663807 RepID=UPI001789F76A
MISVENRGRHMGLRSGAPTGESGGGANSPTLHVRLLGKLSLLVNDNEIELLSRKTKALLGYLALTEAQEESRDRLIGLFWSESSEERARASLRQALHEIRNAFLPSGFEGFHTDKLVVALDRTQIRVDLIDVLKDAVNGSPNPVLLQQQDLIDHILAEVESSDPALQTWVLAKRQTIRDQLIRHLETALRGQTKVTGIGRDIAVAIINLDQTHEEACRYLIRAHVADGAIGSALRVYKTLWDLLEADYDVEPTQQTQDLIAEVKAALPFSGASSNAADAPIPQPEAPADIKPATEPPRSASPAGLDVDQLLAAREPRLILSVGPFVLSSHDSKRDYMAQGFRRELIACFVRFREWHIRDWTSPPTDHVPEGPKDEFILDAGGFETRKALHLVLTLRDGTTGTYLWSESLTLTLENWHQAQQNLVRRIASALNVHVSAERMNRITTRQVQDLKAYDIWLFGQATLLGFDPQRWDNAADLFRQVVRQMPDFAPAHSSLAQLNNSYHIVKPGTARDAKRTMQALAYAQEAVRLDPLDSRSQLCLGWSHAMAKHYEQAMIYIPLAHGLNDNDPWTLVSAANCYAFCGRDKEAAEIVESMLQRKATVAPTALQWAYHTAVRFMIGDYESCVAAADFAGDLNANVPGLKAAALYHLGREQEAAAELNRFFSIVQSRWSAEQPATPAAMTRWFLHLFPIAKPESWARLRDGIEGAGAPTEGLFHHQW